MKIGDNTVKAAICREFGAPLVIEEIAIGAPARGELRVRLAACAICHSDIFYMDGAWGGTLPAVFGHEAAGIVEEVGPGVTRAKIGDAVAVTLIRSCGGCHYCVQGREVLCESTLPLDERDILHDHGGDALQQGLRTGAFAEEVVVDQSQVAVLPPTMPLDSASLLSCGVLTGVGAVVNTAQVRPGSTVAVIGTGGVGLNCVQGAHVAGASKIIALDLSDAKRTAALEFGATDTVAADNPNAADRVRALTDGRGVDYAFVAVGARSAMEQAQGFIAAGGKVVIVGMPPTGVKVEFDPGNLASADQQIIGSKMGSSRVSVDIPWLITLYQQGRLKLDELITGRYPLQEINEAIDEVRRGEALRNVIVF